MTNAGCYSNEVSESYLRLRDLLRVGFDFLQMKVLLADLAIVIKEIGFLEWTVDGKESLNLNAKLGFDVMIPHILTQIMVFMIMEFLDSKNVKYFLIEFLNK